MSYIIWSKKANALVHGGPFETEQDAEAHVQRVVENASPSENLRPYLVVVPIPDE